MWLSQSSDYKGRPMETECLTLGLDRVFFVFSVALQMPGRMGTLSASSVSTVEPQGEQLADQYRHTGVGSDDLQPHYFAGYAEHCKRLAAKLSEAADSARDLSHHHQKMPPQERK